MTDFNIEFAHIYADKKFGDEQFKSVLRLKEVTQELDKNNKTFVSVILIDEYSPKKNKLKETDFLSSIKKEGVNPDFVAYESNLATIAEEGINLIPQKSLLKRQNFKDKEVLLLSFNDKLIGLKDSQSKYSCSLLIAAWILARLAF